MLLDGGLLNLSRLQPLSRSDVHFTLAIFFNERKLEKKEINSEGETKKSLFIDRFNVITICENLKFPLFLSVHSHLQGVNTVLSDSGVTHLCTTCPLWLEASVVALRQVAPISSFYSKQGYCCGRAQFYTN